MSEVEGQRGRRGRRTRGEGMIANSASGLSRGPGVVWRSGTGGVKSTGEDGEDRVGGRGGTAWGEPEGEGKGIKMWPLLAAFVSTEGGGSAVNEAEGGDDGGPGEPVCCLRMEGSG